MARPFPEMRLSSGLETQGRRKLLTGFYPRNHRCKLPVSAAVEPIKGAHGIESQLGILSGKQDDDNIVLYTYTLPFVTLPPCNIIRWLPVFTAPRHGKWKQMGDVIPVKHCYKVIYQRSHLHPQNRSKNMQIR